MCGIAGIVDFQSRPVDEALVQRMVERLRHRGPDEGGAVRLPTTEPRGPQQATGVLASRRLSIVDLASGHQPVSNEDGSVWCVFNGEIYNFQELRTRLLRAGHRLRTHSDTEVIPHLYEEYGPDFVKELDGMFAFALWDDRAQRLLLARDRFGKKPLLYARIGARVVFGSEFQAVLADPTIRRQIDADALDYYLSYFAIPAPLTIYQSVRKVRPGHQLVCEADRLSESPYWTLSFEPKCVLTVAEAEARLRELLDAAVKKRLMSEVPLGVLLSGGIDSSAVVATMAKVQGKRIKTFSIGFDEAAYSELPAAREVAQRFDCEHHEFIVRPDAVEVLPTLVRHFGEPFADSSALATYYLAQMTRQHVTVVLNGDGGDELFGGYDRYAANHAVEMWHQRPRAIRYARKRLRRWWDRLSRVEQPWRKRWRRFEVASTLSRASRYRRWADALNREMKASLVGWHFGSPAEHGLVSELFERTSRLDAVDAMLAVDTAFYLPTDLLVKMDISTMAHSLEARSPFLDHELAAFAAQLPSAMKVRGRCSKYLLRRAFRGTLPAAVLHRSKRGLSVPIERWFQGPLRGFLIDHLVESHLVRDGVLRRSLEPLVRECVEGRVELTHKLWTLLMLELWYRTFMESSDAASSAPGHQEGTCLS